MLILRKTIATKVEKRNKNKIKKYKKTVYKSKK